jgi:arsenate reductase
MDSMSSPEYKVLFLCTGNSARSIFAESILNHVGSGRFVAYSAGSAPKGKVHSLTLQVLRESKLPTAGLRSKGWEEFTTKDSPQFDFVFTVCDDVAGETCPVWAGHTMTAHWGIADPVLANGSDEQKLHAFRTAFIELEARIRTFVNLPLKSLDRLKIQEHLDEIGDSRKTQVVAPDLLMRIAKEP